MTSGFNLGNAYGRIIISDNVDDAVRNAQRSFDGGLRGIGTSMQRFGDSLTGVGARITALTAPITAFGITGVRTASNFESAMAEISARTGLVGEDLDTIKEAAVQMGADTVFSAQQAAEAFLELLSSGQTAEEALQTLPHVLTAAAAGGIELKTAADAVTDIMAAFGLGVEDAESIVNSMARAASSSSADLSSLQQGFGNVGGVAKQFGLSVEETAAILAIFAENGIKGAEAGTQLKSMLLNMTRPTEDVQTAWADFGVSVFDSQGNIRGIGDVMADLRREIDSGRFTEQQLIENLKAIGGNYGLLGLTALTSGQSIEAMQALMEGQTSASEVAAARMNTFAGAAESLKGSIETLQIEALTPFMNEVLKPLVTDLTSIVNRVTAWAKANPDAANTIIKIGAAVTILGPALIGLGLVISTVGTAFSGLSLLFRGAVGVVSLLTGGFTAWAAAVWATVSPLLALAAPIIAGIALGAALKRAWDTNFLGIRDLVEGVVEDIIAWIEEAVRKVGELIDQLEDLLSGPIEAVKNEVERIVNDPLGAIGGDANPFREGSGVLRGVGDLLGIGRDEGGPGEAGRGYLIGAAQAGAEAFIPGDDGHFYPDFARNLAQIAGGVLLSQRMGVTESGLSGAGGGGNQIYVSIEVPLDVLRNEPALAANGETLAVALRERLRRSG